MYLPSHACLGEIKRQRSFHRLIKMAYNLTDAQKDLLREIVSFVRVGRLGEEFSIIWLLRGPMVDGSHGAELEFSNEITSGKLQALEAEQLIRMRAGKHHTNVTLTAAAYSACENDFDSPDTSFFRQLTPLADVSNLDKQLKQRVLPILGAGASDPMLWDSAVRTASVILEERLRDVGNITDGAIGKVLINKVFGGGGSLAGKFAQDSEREAYRDLFAGIVGLVRNPSAHRLIDPTPEDGGVLIVLVNLLLTKLATLR